MLRSRNIQRRFDRAAAGFDDADFVHAVTREGLLARLEPLLINPATILDLGCATGTTGRLLHKRFKRAHVVSLDISSKMLLTAKKSKAWFSRSTFVQGNACHLPFADAVFDMVVANQLLPWIPEPQVVFEQVSRVLKQDGVFTFATLGPDSLREIHVGRFPDMHDIGDGLVRAGLRDPVIDVDRLSVSYDNADKLFADLSRAGARGLISSRKLQAMNDTLGASGRGSKIVLDLELVYGHCWGGGPRNDPANFRIDANKIPTR